VRIETISSRAAALGGEIGGHRHENLAQCLVVTCGGGVLELEGEQPDFAAPWFVWLPAAIVHGFRFQPGTEGHVLTVSDDVVAASLGRVPEGQELAALVPPPIALLRSQTLSGLAANLGDRRAAGFRRFRDHVARHFRRHDGNDGIARSLGMSRAQLHAVTMQAVGKSPLRIRHERRRIGCKRELTCSSQPIGQLAYERGFTNEAHFGRFFSRPAGMSPSAFRKSRRKAMGAA
jgi:AraC family transcriptional activator of pobA